ncbi:JmjC domain-containing protein [Novosphingobium tardum]|uniref:JmjC domain-containing protein n=1 Tax=Novosphingobium tardum TaxID=1538021 RepID=A0ABV8RPI3_9SPHN
MQFSDFDSAAFLRDVWQKKPLLIRNPWTSWHNPLEPDELAGLACEPEVESRLIVQDDTAAPGALLAEHGPFADDRFARLRESPWTLLVQAVDHHVPEVAALLAPFRFVPNWRIDDVMVSYASDGGGVGPHFDHYDVFLLQGLGRRRWRVGPRCDAATPLLPHDDLRLLARFEATDEWVLGPGDILYVPPGFAHDGVAVGADCMTYSIGFRAPSRGELIESWCEDLVEELGDDDRYVDPDLALQDNPGEITAAAIARLHAMITERLADRAGFARWFGRYSSTRKYPEIDWHPDEPIEAGDLRGALAEKIPLVRNPASRFAFVREGADDVVLFVDGESFTCSGRSRLLAEQICKSDQVTCDPAWQDDDSVTGLIARLINQGSVAFASDD